MALTKFGFIVTGDNFEQLQGTDKFQMKVVGVSHPEQGIQAAKQMVADGFQLIELSADLALYGLARSSKPSTMQSPLAWSPTDQSQSTQCTNCSPNKAHFMTGLADSCLIVKLAAEVADLSEDMRSIMSAGVDDVIQRIAGLIDLGKQDQSIQANTEASTLAQVLYQMWLGAALLSKLQKDKTPLHQALRATKFLLKSEDSNKNNLPSCI